MKKTQAVLAGFGVLALLLLAVFVSEHSYSLYDDAFIYLRYVKNVRSGCGLRFNCDEPRVEGFSGPLWLALLVLGSQVTRKLVTLTQVLGVGSFGVLLVATPFVAAQTHGEESMLVRRRLLAAALATALLALDHFALLNAVIGLESGLAAALVLLAYGAVVAGRKQLAIALAFAIALIRPEGGLFVLGLFLLPWARTRRIVIGCGAGLGAIVLVRWLLFHDVVPNTVWAKSGGTAKHWQLGAEYVFASARSFPTLVLGVLVVAWRAARTHARFVLVPSVVWTLGVAMAGGDTFEYARLLFPLVPALTVCAVQGALALARRPVLEGVIAAGFAALAVRAGVLHSLAPSHRFENVARWTAIGQYLKAKMPHARIATVPIGAIGYFSENELLDLVGLTSPPIAKAGRTVPPERLTSAWIGHERNDLEYTLGWAPDLLITTKYRSEPYRTLDEASTGFWSDWLFLQAIKAGGAPYHVKDLEVLPTLHVLAFERDAQ